MEKKLLFFKNGQTYYAISRAVGIRFFIFKLSLDLFPLAFERRIPNCSTVKTRKAMAKKRHKVENNWKGGGYNCNIHIEACFCNPSLQVTSFKNQVLVLTFWIVSKNVEKPIEKGIFSKLLLK